MGLVQMMGDSITGFIRNVFLALWPIIAIILGLVFGIAFGLVITTFIFLLAAIRTPMHMGKMLYVTATTEECFKGGILLENIMRIAVFLCVPIVHVVFLVAITIFASTVGMMYCIGGATMMFYNHEYTDAIEKLQSNAKLQSESYLGEFYRECQDFMVDDTNSFPTIYALKGCCAFVPSVILGMLPVLPFSMGMLLLTLHRLPINLYKTMKITLFTVLLKLDLKIMVLLTIPIILILLFPALVFLGSVIVSYGSAVLITTESIVKGDRSPFQKWDQFRKWLEQYYDAHRKFVAEAYEPYDDATGIPLGWDGTSYGIPIRRILKWQWDLVMMCCFFVYGAFIGLVGSSIIAIVKYIPCCLYFAKEISSDTSCYCRGRRCAVILSLWPFYVTNLFLIPVANVLLAILLVAVWTCSGFLVSFAYLDNGYKAALHQALGMLGSLDMATAKLSFGCRIFTFDGENPYAEEGRRRVTATATTSRANQVDYWDRFVDQSIETTKILLTEKKWIRLEDVRAYDPAVVQSIPAVAILTVLADSVGEPGLNKEDVIWKVDGTICKREEYPLHDGITRHLCPMAFEIMHLLRRNNKDMTQKDNVEMLTAMLCANGEDDTEELKKYMEQEIVDGGEDSNSNLRTDKNNLRTKVNRMVLALLRVRPFQDRMNRIFEYDYLAHPSDIETGVTDRTSSDDMNEGDDRSTETAAAQLALDSENEAEKDHYGATP